MRDEKVKKKNQIWIWSCILCMCIILSSQYISAFAESQEKEYIENTDVQAYTVEEVKAMIDVLPSVSEMENMSEEDLNQVYEQAQNAYDAFEALTGEEQEELADELEKLSDIMDFFSSQVDTLYGDELPDGYITSIAFTFDGSREECYTNLLKHNWSDTMVDWDFNEEAGGKYVYMGYKKEDDYSNPITGVKLRVSEKDDKPDYITDSNGVQYNLVGGRYEANMCSAESGAVDLNKGAGGNYIFVYVTRDKRYSPLINISVTDNYSNSSWEVASDKDGNVVNANPKGRARYIVFQRYNTHPGSKRRPELHYLNESGTQKYEMVTGHADWPDGDCYPSVSVPKSVSYNGYTLQLSGWKTNNYRTDTTPDRSEVCVKYNEGDCDWHRLPLYAIYQATVQVSYNANSGSGAPSAQTSTATVSCQETSPYMHQHSYFTIPSTTPTKSGGICNKFLGWSTDKNATTAEYKAEKGYVFKSNTTLYAVYQNDHTYSSDWSTSTTTHWHAATCGHSVTADNASHSWSKGVCTVCQYKCQHNGLRTGYCTICGSCLSDGEILDEPSQQNGIYLIYNSKNLAWFSAYVNGVNAGIKGKLMANIDMSSTAWDPIGTDGKPYSGTFEGNGNKVTLKLSSDKAYLAMFSYVNGATIQNLTVDGTIDASNHFAASIIGRVTGGTVTLQNCLSVVTINSSFDGDGTHGGLVSIVAGGTLTLQNCGFAGKMIGSQTEYCGGMVGWTDKSAKTNISNSYVAAEFNLEDNSGNTFGRNPNYVSLTNCYYLNALSDASVATKMTAEQFQSGEVTWLLNNKSASGAWKQTINSDGYPNFSGQTVYYGYSDCTDRIYTNNSLQAEKGEHLQFTENGFCVKCNAYQPAVWNSNAGYYEISNAGQLFWFAEYVNTDKVNRKTNGVLMKDIDLENKLWTPIGLYSDDSDLSANSAGYTGTFDGRCHVISNLFVFMTRNYEAGLFSRVAGGGELKNFGVINAVVKQPLKGHDNKGVRAGIIAGEIYRATVKNVFTAGTLTLKTEHDQYGGLAGECKDSALTSCYTTKERLTDGTSGNTPLSVTRCYYQADENNSASAGENMTEIQFTSGEVTYKLNDGVTDGTQVWYQTIGTDAYPKFTGDIVYYQEKRDEYSNSEQIISVEITWTEMRFSYSMEMWDAENETWNEGEWIAEDGCGTVDVKNTGTVEVTATFDVETTDDSCGISVDFMVNDTPLEDGKLELDVDEQKTVAVKLTGDEPSEYIEEGMNIGQITVKVS